MKKVLILFFICVCISSMQAQKRYVVAFDCTKSMNHPDGDYTNKGLDDSKLWKPAKNCIHSLWTQASPSDEFYILLFQNNVLEIVKGCKGTQLKDWNSIECRMNEAIKMGGNTCIFRAWQTAEQYFTDNCDFYFITDGVEDHDNNNQINDDEQAHIDAICKKIDEFCNMGINAFYTNLKQSENDIINNSISKKIKASCFKDLIAGCISPESLSIDQQDLEGGGKTFNLAFKPVDRHRVANINSLNARFENKGDNVGLQNADSYFRPVISGIKNNQIELVIEHLTKVPQALLDNENSCKLYLKISSNDNDVAIFPQLISIDVRYYYEKIAYLPSSNLEGTTKYHPAFFFKPLAYLFSGCDFIAEHKPDTIVFDLKNMLSEKKLFNDEAQKRHSSYKLKLVPIRQIDKDAKFLILKNGEVCSDNTIGVSCNDDSLLISVVFNESSADGKFEFKLEPIEPKELDKINECINISEASIPVFLEFDKQWNPLNNLLFWIGFIIFVMAITRILYSHLRKGIYAGIDYFIDGSQEVLVKKRKCNRIILSPVPKKQKIIDWLFNGKTLYNIEPIKDLKSEIKLNAAGRKRRIMRARLCPTKEYLFDDMKIRKQIITSDEDVMHTISDMKNNIILTFIFY